MPNKTSTSRPGTPSLLRELNDRAALRLLLDGRSLTRSQLSELTGVSKVTVAQMLARLEDRGLVAAVGEQAGGRGPNAMLYSVVPSSAYVAGLYVEQGLVAVAVADVTGRVVAEVREDTNGAAEPVELVRSAVDRACGRAGISVERLSAFVIGSPGVVDPRTGDPWFAFNLPEWHEGVLAGLRGALRRPVLIENDVNLAAIAERASGAAAGSEEFVLLWVGIGIGLATVLGGRLHRGVSGAAGEIGWLPMPGAPVTSHVRNPSEGGLQWLAGAEAVRGLASRHGFGAPRAGDCVRAAVQELSYRTSPRSSVASSASPAPSEAPVDTAAPSKGPGDAAAPSKGPGDTAAPSEVAMPAGERASSAASSPVSVSVPASSEAAAAFLGELAHRIALGATAVCAVLDPGLVVLGGEVGLAGGTVLADLVAAEVTRMSPLPPRVVPTAVNSEPVLRGALLTAVEQARADLLASVAG
jgi:predicted NBD/HSP70 family sugar kinase